MSSFTSRVVIVFVTLVLGLGAPVPAAAAPEGTMTWGVHITLASRWLDPCETEGIATPFMVLYALHDALVKPMPAGTYTPSLAESFTQSKDGLTYEFVIRKGAKFHNGEPVTTADVKFSFNLYPWPPYVSMGEALAWYLQAVGIRTKVRTMERAALTTA